MVHAARLVALLGVVAACPPPPPHTHVLQVTKEELLLDGRFIAHADLRSMCEDCRYVDSLLEVLTAEPPGRVVQVDFDPDPDPAIEHEVLFTIGHAGDAALVRYSVLAK